MSVEFVYLESGDGKQTHPGLWFFAVWHRGIPDSMLLLLHYCWAQLEPPLIISFVLSLQSSGFFVFLEFVAPFVLDLFPWTSKVRLVLAV